MPLRSDPATAAHDWQRNLSASTEKITRGVQRVNRAPGQAAASKADKYRQGVLDNVDKWRANVGSVTLPEWQQATVASVGRVAEGAQQKVHKVERFFGEFFPVLANVVQRADQMPDNTLDQRIQKSAFVMRELSHFRRRGVGGGQAGR